MNEPADTPVNTPRSAPEDSPQGVPPKVSVLICTRNRPQDLVHALPTVLANDYPDFEVIVVDQSDGRETAAIVLALQGRCPALRYVPTETRGLSAARNLAVGLAQGEIIAFTDDDCEAPPGWIAAIARVFADNLEFGLIFGQVHMLPEHLGRDVSVPCLYFDARRILTRGEVFGMGANMAFRRSAWDRVGVYDTALGVGGIFPGGEDFDFSYRAQRLGLTTVAEPSVVLVHRAFRTEDRWHAVLRSYGAGDAAFYAKHARCGDGWAARVLLARIARAGLRAAAKALLRRRPNNDLCYLQGLVAGLWRSLGTPVDRQTRFYRPAGGLERP